MRIELWMVAVLLGTWVLGTAAIVLVVAHRAAHTIALLRASREYWKARAEELSVRELHARRLHR